MASEKNSDLLMLTAEIVAAQISRTQTNLEDIPRIIEEVYTALKRVDCGAISPPQRRKPAVEVDKSIQPDFLICLEDGKKLKMLKRHLKTRYNLTPEEYRVRWNLPPDYPMVAPNYAKKRQQLAKAIGLGRQR